MANNRNTKMTRAKSGGDLLYFLHFMQNCFIRRNSQSSNRLVLNTIISLDIFGADNIDLSDRLFPIITEADHRKSSYSDTKNKYLAHPEQLHSLVSYTLF